MCGLSVCACARQPSDRPGTGVRRGVFVAFPLCLARSGVSGKNDAVFHARIPSKTKALSAK